MIRKLSRSAVATVAAVVPLVLLTAMPAQAASSATIVVTGTGTISPGLTPTGGPQTFSFSGTGATTGVVCGVAEANVTHSISAGGFDIIGSWAAGEGWLMVTVSGNAGCPGGLTLTGTYVRQGVRLGDNLEIAVSAGTTLLTADCVERSDQTPPAPTASYHLNCVAHLTGTA